MRSEHAIFHSPLKADITLDGEPWEEAGDGQHTWIVQTGKEGKENDYGVVSDGHGFEDSPDCERISGGVNSKGPHALAIGRQANMLQWGFYCAPDRMTQSARKVFLNALVYMRQFDGEKPLVAKKSIGRGWLRQYADALSKLTPAQRKETGERTYAAYLRTKFPAELLDGDDVVDKLNAWLQTNEERFVANENREVTVDTDLVELRTSNRTPGFFAAVIARLEKNAGDALAARLIAHYLPKDVEGTAAGVRSFWEHNRASLFFSDVGGYRWFVDPRPRAASPAPSKN